jgi:hypothetical protein
VLLLHWSILLSKHFYQRITPDSFYWEIVWFHQRLSMSKGRPQYCIDENKIKKNDKKINWNCGIQCLVYISSKVIAHNITEILLKVALNTIIITIIGVWVVQIFTSIFSNLDFLVIIWLVFFCILYVSWFCINKLCDDVGLHVLLTRLEENLSREKDRKIVHIF